MDKLGTEIAATLCVSAPVIVVVLYLVYVVISRRGLMTWLVFGLLGILALGLYLDDTGGIDRTRDVLIGIILFFGGVIGTVICGIRMIRKAAELFGM